MRNTDTNIFVFLLRLLKVKHTKCFSNDYFNKNSRRHNLFELSKMLSDYGIDSGGVKIEDKENDIFSIECPFVAQVENDFAVVSMVDSDKVHCFFKGEKLSVSISQFIQAWSGVLLLTESTANSVEPNYKKHRIKELLSIAQKTILVLAGFLILVITYVHNDLFANIGISLLLLINLLGVFVCSLLILKQINVNKYADKICSLFSKGDCNNVLESQASKLWGVFGFSEIGLGYFSVNVLLLLFLPKVVFVLAVLNLLTLPYVFWSIWYQKVKVKQWCPLCIIVQVLLWSNFIINFLVGYINLQELNLLIIIFVACLYVIFVFGFNIIIQIFSKRIEVERIKQNFNSLKANEEVFSILLKQQPKYDVSRNDSQIIVGNSEAPMLVTIFTNPFCKPCAKMHKQVKKLIEGAKDNICVQYIFSSSNNETDLVCKNLIAVYLKKGQKEFEVIFDDWFEKGKFIRDFFFSNLQLDLNNLEVEIELEQHKTCTEKTQIQATPTILINSYQLPIDYDIEDLLYLTEFSVNIK